MFWHHYGQEVLQLPSFDNGWRPFLRVILPAFTPHIFNALISLVLLTLKLPKQRPYCYPTWCTSNRQIWFCLLFQENKPIGTSILQLSVIDQDSSHNGPPFEFYILSGNEGGEFVLEKDGTLVANQVFRRDLATEYAIQIQVVNLLYNHHTCRDAVVIFQCHNSFRNSFVSQWMA